jgi:hypothetical protein
MVWLAWSRGQQRTHLFARIRYMVWLAWIRGQQRTNLFARIRYGMACLGQGAAED